MRLDSMFDSLSVLSSLWGISPSPQVCLSSPDVLPHAAREITWAPMPRILAGVTVFVDVNVVPMDSERALANQTVVVEGGRITALGPTAKVTVPAGAVRIDGRGKYLIPGLGNMHAHQGVGHLKETLHRGDFFGDLGVGVTTVRVLDYEGGPNDFIDSTHFAPTRALRRLVQSPPSPRLYFPPMNLNTIKLEHVAAYVTRAKAEGYAFLGMNSWMRFKDGVVFDSLVATARRLGLRVTSHHHHLPFRSVLALGSTGGSIEHLSGTFWDTLGLWSSYGGGLTGHLTRPTVAVPLVKIPALAAALQRAGVWVTPTLDCMERRHTHIKGLPQIVKIMQDAGVGLLLGQDDGGSAHDELEALVGAGLSPYQALLTGTRNVAQFLGRLDSSGTIAVGKWADLVLLEGNPLTDIRQTREPVGVMINGHWLDRTTLDQGLLAAKEPISRGSWLTWRVAHYGMKTLNERGAQADRFSALVDSLAAVSPAAKDSYERLRRRVADELGALRAGLTPAQQVRFDAIARVWLREQARQGYKVTVPDVAPTP
jgi:imidazolonepropionase-like amidohydrolase